MPITIKLVGPKANPANWDDATKKKVVAAGDYKLVVRDKFKQVWDKLKPAFDNGAEVTFVVSETRYTWTCVGQKPEAVKALAATSAAAKQIGNTSGHDPAIAADIKAKFKTLIALLDGALKETHEGARGKLEKLRESALEEQKKLWPGVDGQIALAHKYIAEAKQQTADLKRKEAAMSDAERKKEEERKKKEDEKRVRLAEDKEAERKKIEEEKKAAEAKKQREELQKKMDEINKKKHEEFLKSIWLPDVKDIPLKLRENLSGGQMAVIKPLLTEFNSNRKDGKGLMRGTHMLPLSGQLWAKDGGGWQLSINLDKKEIGVVNKGGKSWA